MQGAARRDTGRMLVRMFRGVARAGMEDRYARYLRDVAAPHLLSHSGVRDVHIFDPLRPDGAFVVKTVWDDVASLTAFAGDDWARPTILPAEAEMVASADVSHHRPGPRYDTSSVVSHVRRVTVDPAAGIAKVDGDVFELPPLESRLLAELVQRAGRFTDPSELARAVWRGHGRVHPNDVRRAVYRLRKLIGDDARDDPLIRGRRGYGYRVE